MYSYNNLCLHRERHLLQPEYEKRFWNAQNENTDDTYYTLYVPQKHHLWNVAVSFIRHSLVSLGDSSQSRDLCHHFQLTTTIWLWLLLYTAASAAEWLCTLSMFDKPKEVHVFMHVIVTQALFLTQIGTRMCLRVPIAWVLRPKSLSFGGKKLKI